MNAVIDPVQLASVKQAAYISKALINGKSKQEIAKAFYGDRQLVDMWIMFLVHNHWIVGEPEWHSASKGRIWLLAAS
jgi:hypothetical protein